MSSKPIEDDQELSTGPGTIIYGMANKDEATSETQKGYDWIAYVIRDLCEMPGYDSPPDFPEGIVCTSDEIRHCIEENSPVSDLERRLRATVIERDELLHLNGVQADNVRSERTRAEAAERERDALAKTVGTYQAELKHECQNSETQEARAEAAERELAALASELERERTRERTIPSEGAALRKLGERLTHLLDENQWPECERLILDAAEELASVKADAERMDWLQLQKVTVCRPVHHGIDVCFSAVPFNQWDLQKPSDLRQQIDRAAKGGKT